MNLTELHNWREYLQFMESQGDVEATIDVFERCLIPCANYTEIWLRYVDFLVCLLDFYLLQISLL